MIQETQDQLIDIYDIWYQPFWKSDWFYYTSIGLICCFLLYFLRYLYMQHKYKITSIDYTAAALKELEQLDYTPIITLADSKDFYFRLSLIIKNYLAARYNVSCLQLTDKEILDRMKKILDQQQFENLCILLQGMTFVKFDKKMALSEQIQHDVRVAQEFIKKNSLPDPIKEN